MLNFVIGTAGTGKSTYINNKIVQLAKEGEKCLLIVPEQFSKTGEAMLFSSLEDAQINLVNLFSFTSLVRDVQNNFKELAVTPLTSAGKAVMARRAVENVKNHLDIYSSRMSNFGFYFTLSDTFDTLKRSGLSGEILYSLTKKAPQKNARLKELALIYSEYCGLMGNKFCDSEDILCLLAQQLPPNYTYNTHIFIDGFESFSNGQLKVIEKLLTDAKDVTVALCCDELYDSTGGIGNFSFVQDTAGQLIRIAKNCGITIAKPILLHDSIRFKNQQLKQLDLFLQNKDTGNLPKEHGNIFISDFETQFDEVCFTVAQINKLVQQGFAYNDIAVVCPQLEKYENQLQESLSLAKIPYFIDANRIISSSAPVIFFKTVFDIFANGLDSENLIALLKSGLTEFNDETIAMLENYLYVWQDYKFDFSEKFRLSPGGVKPEPEESEISTLETIDKIRRHIYKIFQKNKPAPDTTSSDIISLVYNTAIQLGADKKLKSTIEALSDGEKSQLLTRQWNTVIECLDRLYTILLGDNVPTKDLGRLFMLMIDGESIGFAPQTQDCVMITDPKRMKLVSVEAVIIIGAAQDFFPRLVDESGLIGPVDREYLRQNEYPLKNDFKNLFAFENLYYYKALTSPRQYLYISSCKKNIDCRQQQSSYIELLKDNLDLPFVDMALEDYAVTNEFFTDYISGQANNLNRSGYTHLLGEIGCQVSGISDRNFAVEDISLIENLLGDSITISPTGAQNYFMCEFMYFLQRILKIKPLEKAEFSAKLAGDYLHFIAQQVMEKYGEDYYATPWENIQQDIKTAVENFIKEKYPPQMYNDTSFTAQHENMMENANQLLKYIHTEQSESMFRPVAFEEKIGLDGNVPALKVTAENGKTVNIVGVRDRIDIYRGQENDYLRIVDYKTGKQKFDLDEVYNGLSSQLLLYMSALLETDFAKKDKPLKAGAVVYQPADAQFKFDKPEDALYTAVGMALANPEISAAFDSAYKGRFGVISGDEKLKELPGSKIAGEKKFDIIMEYVKDNIRKMALGVYEGQFRALPLNSADGSTPCKWCRFKSVCLYRGEGKNLIKNEFDKMEKED